MTHLYYIAGGEGLRGIYVKQTAGSSVTLRDSMYYAHTDHLGSLAVITGKNGNIVQQCKFDAWGKRSFDKKDPAIVFDRGWQSHEHMDEFKLLNMNGRCYDPVLGRFLSADPVVQNPLSSQSYNRYSGLGNNPLRFIDPSGKSMEDALKAMYNFEGGGFYYRGEYYVNGGGGGFYSTSTGARLGGGGSSYSYNWTTGNYINNNTGNEAPWNEVSSYQNYYMSNNGYKVINWGYNYKIEDKGNFAKYDIWINIEYIGGTSPGANSPNGGTPTGGYPDGLISGLDKFNQYNTVAWAFVAPAANAGIQVSNQVINNTRNATLIAREMQALNVLKPIAVAARGFNIAGVGISTGIAGYKVYTGTATTLDKVDFGLGLGALGAAGGAFLLGSNPVGWAILGGAGIYYTGRMVYDWLY